VQCKMGSAGEGLTRQDCLELGPCFQSLHDGAHRN
jgi:hypothetical protein